ncbi:hypothetical protein PoB_002319800 [Plakobranchus ocellatus]|uniref:Secreted protein n=1 Tax=Plakobranchus ocellatus TaxID=259542 RepID=A0AAV3ZPC6_9GAST|nr:hypothetical protein PoB_002319800 [Plakobranchus ocellatus]
MVLALLALCDPFTVGGEKRHFMPCGQGASVWRPDPLRLFPLRSCCSPADFTQNFPPLWTAALYPPLSRVVRSSERLITTFSMVRTGTWNLIHS